MADFLTHLFLPLTAVYVLRPDLFPTPTYLGLAAFGLLGDLDKFLGHPGLTHSLVTLVPLCAVVLGVERWWRGESTYGPVIVALVLSHLLLDFLDGGPVPLLFPIVETGVGLEYPIRTVFGRGPVGLTFEGPLVRLRTSVPAGGFNTYGFIQGLGVANAALFATVYVGTELRDRTGHQ